MTETSRPQPIYEQPFEVVELPAPKPTPKAPVAQQPKPAKTPPPTKDSSPKPSAAPKSAPLEPVTTTTEKEIAVKSTPPTAQTAPSEKPVVNTPALEQTMQTTTATQSAPPAPAKVNDYVAPDITAAYRDNPKPAYPMMAKRRGLEGIVMLAVEINAQGIPQTVAIKQSSGHRVLDDSALSAVRHWRFSPAMRAGNAVAASIEIPIRFSLK